MGIYIRPRSGWVHTKDGRRCGVAIRGIRAAELFIHIGKPVLVRVIQAVIRERIKPMENFPSIQHGVPIGIIRTGVCMVNEILRAVG